MKLHITIGIALLGAAALSSCSTTKLASNQSFGDDDVYHTQAKAGDAPVYAARPVYRNEDPGVGSDGYEDDYYTTDDEYYYYDDYSSRINRFGYFSPFGYYDNLYYGYGPYGPGYGSGWGLGLGYGYGGWGLGVGYGWGGYGYSPWGYSPWGYGGYGYGLGYGGLGYSYWGTGWGGSPYWGVYSAYRSSGNARPIRGSGNPRSGLTAGRNSMGNNNGAAYYPNRPNRLSGTGANGSYTGRGSNGAGRDVSGDSRVTRPTREAQPSYQPQPTSRPSSSPSSFGGGSSGGGSRGGGGGGRPSRN
ncbi:hypothetical protein [Mucilaginibacter defluvii]|uniref:Vitellogenin II n=1 Tax=Mucilaginibacter defluvii TaxID=1196019 RepID=A0ABP9FVD9_9SPHI